MAGIALAWCAAVTALAVQRLRRADRKHDRTGLRRVRWTTDRVLHEPGAGTGTGIPARDDYGRDGGYRIGEAPFRPVQVIEALIRVAVPQPQHARRAY